MKLEEKIRNVLEGFDTLSLATDNDRRILADAIARDLQLDNPKLDGLLKAFDNNDPMPRDQLEALARELRSVFGV